MRYKISFELVLDDNDPSQPDWIIDSVCENLNPGECIENFNIETLS